MTKPELRKQILARRAALSGEERRAKSAAVQQRLLDLPEFQAAGRVLFFVSFSSEVETLPMIEQALRLGKEVAAPKVMAGQPELELRRLTDPQAQLQPGKLGILEPNDDCPLVSLAEADLIIVPAVAWDERGYRVGYGGGFYDRLLARAGDVPKIGLGFECQVISEVPRLAHDLGVDILVTEERVLRFR